jgi:hypothetical protein
VRAAVETGVGVAIVDIDDEEILEYDADLVVERAEVGVELPRVIAADASGPLVVAVVARRPPLVVSHDAGSTWRETGHGLPAGRAVAVSPEHPDRILFAGESRLYLSRDGGRFWQPLALELEDIRALAWLDIR